VGWSWRSHSVSRWRPCRSNLRRSSSATGSRATSSPTTRWARALHDLPQLERWHTDRVVLIRDAAHAMVPHQGQGANQTIEDAIVLADALAAAERGPSALPRYTLLRRKRATAVQWLSRRTADLMHLPDGPDRAPRDAALAELYSGLAWIYGHDASKGNPRRWRPG